MPKTPEEWLASPSHRRKPKASLKLFLGYAPGVGKTYSMLSEAIRRKSRGEDIVIGIVETHGRKGTVNFSTARICAAATKSITKARSLRRWMWTQSSHAIRR